ncbi:hypothetical protein F66182_1474 [Fusarium sp. NRRL 66182]|nr:hypothetical protein F66182_1474 [Fusarium sp. NRRL 66182]
MWNATGPDTNRNAPPGVVPDYDNPRDVCWTVNVAMMTICVVFVAVFFFIRVFVKLTINRKMLLEDLARYGAGHHAWEIPRLEYYSWLKWFYGSTVVYNPAAFFTKATILLLMARVFAVEPRVAKGIRIFIGALLVAYIPIQVLRIYNCDPIRTWWDPTVREARCLNQRKIFFSSLSLSIITDLLTVIIPIPLTWHLKMPLRKKIKIVLLLGAGGVATGLTVYRMVLTVDFLDSDDITVDFTPIDILTALELTIGFVCACLPSLNLLIEHHIRTRRRERRPSCPRERKAHSSTMKRHFRWVSSTTDPSAKPPSQHAADRTCGGMIDLDVEMAMLTGQPVRLQSQRRESEEPLGLRPLEHRLNSGDGRRDGWLSSDRDDRDERKDATFIMKMVEGSRARAEEGAKESWCPVWDGPRDPLATPNFGHPSWSLYATASSASRLSPSPQPPLLSVSELSDFGGNPESCEVRDDAGNALGSGQGQTDTTFIGVAIGQDATCVVEFEIDGVCTGVDDEDNNLDVVLVLSLLEYKY